MSCKEGARLFTILRPFVLIIVVLLITSPLYADWVTDTVPAGSNPRAICVDPVTNKIYVANAGGSVTVIDGVTNLSTTIAAGNYPFAICVNPSANKIYVANNYGNNVTVIDGATNSVSYVAAGTGPHAICVNPNTNKIYVANGSSNNVTVIDGLTNSTANINTGGIGPYDICVNPNTNKIYVANVDSNSVTVIDGTSNSTATVAVGASPRAICVNPSTNKIYVANYNSSSVTVIDGETSSTATVAVGAYSRAICVNPVTNKIYVASTSGSVTVIDGATNSTTSVTAGNQPYAICVNVNTNKIYVANRLGDDVTVIDGATNSTTTVPAIDDLYAICVNPITNKIYVPNNGSSNVTVIDGADTLTTTIPVGSWPNAIALNPGTNKIYVANRGSDEVTVIEGPVNSSVTVTVGDEPRSICLNPNTNNIYVANYSSSDVTIIDGATNSTTTIAVGSNPSSICVNPNTNKIYVTNINSNNVMVIDGITNSTTTIPDVITPFVACVNPVTNKIYVASMLGDHVAVIDGAIGSISTIPAGDEPYAMCVNPITNKIYVTNILSNNVTVIDGETNLTSTVTAGTFPIAICVNPNTNKIYVANLNSNDVTVIDGATNSTVTISVANAPSAISVNINTNKIYVANSNSDNVTVIDGTTNSTMTVPVGTAPGDICVNYCTNRIYVANTSSNDVTVIQEARISDLPLVSSIIPFPGNITENTLPQFTGNSVNSRNPYNCDIMKVLCQIDETREAWEEAYITSGGGTEWVSWQAPTTEPLTTGFHSIYVVALDMTSATINMTENFAGSITPYYFFVASSYVDIEESSLAASYSPENPWTADGTVSIPFTVRNTSGRVLENIGFSSSDLVSGSNHIHGNTVSFSPSVVSELQPGYAEEITATVPISIGQSAGTYTGRFGTSIMRSSPDYVNVSITVDSLKDLDIQDYGGNLSANTMVLPGVENSVVIGRFNLSSPNSKDDNYDPFDGPGNTDIDNIVFIPDTLFAYGHSDWISPSGISMIDSVVTLSSGSAYQCIMQVSIPPAFSAGRDFMGYFTVQSGAVDDKFSLIIRVVEPGGSSGISDGLQGEAVEEGNRVYWSDFKLNETGYNVYRSTLQGESYTKLNDLEISRHEYLDENVNIGETYRYKLGAKVGGNRELLLGPIILTTIGGSSLPEESWLAPCEPNPFRISTQIKYQITKGEDAGSRHVTLNVYNISGMLVKTLVDEDCLPGFYSVNWDGRDGNNIVLPNGIYFYSLKVDDFTAVQKAVLMR